MYAHSVYACVFERGVTERLVFNPAHFGTRVCFYGFGGRSGGGFPSEQSTSIHTVWVEGK